MDESKFWEMIDAAWATVDADIADTRRDLVQQEDDDREEAAEALAGHADEMVDALREALRELPQPELLAFDRILERKLYDIDREEIQEITDGSDDGFLYCRGFIVAMGREYYDAIDRDPSHAICDAECEQMTYVSFHLMAELYGDAAWTPSDISRESCSNAAGWGRDPDEPVNVRGNLVPVAD